MNGGSAASRCAIRCEDSASAREDIKYVPCSCAVYEPYELAKGTLLFSAGAKKMTGAQNNAKEL